MSRHITLLCFVAALQLAANARADVSYERDVAPILVKYCVGCHSDDDPEGELSLETYAALQNGNEHGPVLVARDVQASRMIRLLTGQDKPKMPPDDEPAPTAGDIATLKQWILEGATGPRAESPARNLVTPKISPSTLARPITAVALSPDEMTLAVARFGIIELTDARTQSVTAKLEGHAGKINSLAFVDNESLIVASGITGLRGEVVEWHLPSREVVRRIDGHRDIIYSAVPSPDGKLIATAGYARDIILWSRETGEQIRTIAGHNGAIFDLAFTPDSKILASASADATIKIWDVATGERFDTLSQPLKEQYSVAIGPDGKYVYACGEDNRIRKWELISVDGPKINPIEIARFGHEQSVEIIRLSRDGKTAVTTSSDGTVKVWNAESLTEIASFPHQPDSVQAIAVHGNHNLVTLGRMDGSIETMEWSDSKTMDDADSLANSATRSKTQPLHAELNSFSDLEPNGDVSTPQDIELPATVTGTFNGDKPDVDLYRFTANAGDTWIFEVKAADKSPVDAHVAILHEDGQPVLRTRLQAVRDSYFTFRGKDSNTTGDFRLHNWREMQLNQYLYSAGEVVKLYHYPRGPDSGFNVYPNFGQRFGYFDTTPIAHALGAACYIVEPRTPNEMITPNGLPVFPIYFENDDASDRSDGSNSRLTFTAPKSGRYIVAARDVRGFFGDEYKYSLVARVPKPDFELSVGTQNPKVSPGTGKTIDLKLKRFDGFTGEVTVNIENLPEGFAVSGPVTFEQEHLRAWAVLTATENAQQPSEEAAKASVITAIASINGEEVTKRVGTLGKIELGEKPKVTVSIASEDGSPGVLEVIPGTTVTAQLKIVRHDHSDRVAFGSEEALINSPHGIYVDNIGLNGVLIPEGQNERTIFITAEPWVKPTERWVFMEAGVANNPTSYPILLRVVPRNDVAQSN
ncbi:MAG: hypothetical protein KDB27_19490 [Planctomycetales bacterium]|nr:hypothetical protein [Planctomycetales bacterium]